MRTIRPIKEEDLEVFITISANAYPGLDLFAQADRNRFRDRLWRAAKNPHIHHYALFEDGQMRGVMRLYDFTMKLLSTKTLVGGVGSVAVDLLHKKEKVAADMLRHFLQHYRQKGACLTALYPFRPDFYKHMGFGYGTKMSSYRFPPASLPRGHSKQRVVFLNAEDREGLSACYNRYLERSNGLMERWQDVWDIYLADPSLQLVGAKKGDRIDGYLAYKFEKGKHDHFLSNKIVIQELVYENPEVLRELTTFLHSQADQIEQIVLNTQDDQFHHLLIDPRFDSKDMLPGVIAHESNMQGVGIMYRVIDLPRLFEVLSDHNFAGLNCRLKIELSDSFLPENEGDWLVNFTDGRAKLVDDQAYDVAIQMDVSEFSSMIVGAVGFAKLFEYGLASINDLDYIPLVDNLFGAAKPVCLTRF